MDELLLLQTWDELQEAKLLLFDYKKEGKHMFAQVASVFLLPRLKNGT